MKLKLFLSLAIFLVLAGFSHAATCVSGGYGTAGGAGTCPATVTRCYWVAAAGATSNSGTLASPWLHHPEDVNKSGNEACTLSHGEIVYMNSGDTWYSFYATTGAGGTAASNDTITTTSYGTGAKPKLYAFYDPATLSWTSDGSNVYHTTADTEVKVAVYRKAGSDIFLTVDTKDNASCTTPTSNHVCWKTTGTLLYVNVGEDPTTGTILASNKNYSVLNQHNYRSWINLDMEGGNSATIFDGTAMVSTSYLNSTIKYAAGTVLYLYQANGPTVSGVTIVGPGVGSNYEGWFRDIGSSGITVTNSDFSAVTLVGSSVVNYYGTSTGPVTSSGNKYHDALNGMSMAATFSGTVSFTNEQFYNLGAANGAYGLSTGASGTTGSNLLFHNIRGAGISIVGNNFTFSDITGYNLGYTADSSWPFTYPTSFYPYGGSGGGSGLLSISGNSAGNTLTRFKQYNSYQGPSLNAVTGAAGGNSFTWGIVYDMIVNGVGTYGSANGVTKDAFQNISIDHLPSSSNTPAAYAGHAFHVQPSAGTNANVKVAGLVIRNRTPIHTDKDSGTAVVIASNGGTINSVYIDYNVYWCPNGGNVANFKGTGYTDFNAYRTAVQADVAMAGIDGVQASAESHSRYGDPLWVDPANGNFKTMFGSPARGLLAGVGLYTGKANVFDQTGTVRVTDGGGNEVVLTDAGGTQSLAQSAVGFGM
jgi:hypothetical protein